MLIDLRARRRLRLCGRILIWFVLVFLLFVEGWLTGF